MKILENLNKYVVYGIYGMFLMTVLNTCNGCSTAKENTKLRKEVTVLSSEVDSLSKMVINIPVETATKKEIEDIVDNKMWKFLELEELSDKNNIPINELKHKDKN